MLGWDGEPLARGSTGADPDPKAKPAAEALNSEIETDWSGASGCRRNDPPLLLLPRSARKWARPVRRLDWPLTIEEASEAAADAAVLMEE
jgi:hypothetical protein